MQKVPKETRAEKVEKIWIGLSINLAQEHRVSVSLPSSLPSFFIFFSFRHTKKGYWSIFLVSEEKGHRDGEVQVAG